MSSYPLTRTAFKAQRAKDAANYAVYQRSLTWQQRLRLANLFNSIAYGYPESEPPKLDRTIFSAWSKEEQDKSEIYKFDETMLKSAVPILASLNEEETIKFYTEKLGFTFYSSWEGYLILGLDKINLHLWPCTDPEIAKNTGCYINVKGIDKLYAKYEPLGIIHPNGKLEEKPWRMKQFSILDNNGNIIHFGEDMGDD
ncbi:MAG TPA: VOC family protein [Mucilaginibacter sp.]|jgi:hypothetical protein|nr:VOC family protein [Mucilaginibacter sp.]